MKSFLKFLAASLLLLAACKKDNNGGYQQLSITGIGSVAFASGDVVSIYGTGFDTIPDNNIVSFNGVAGEVVTAMTNRIQVIAPLLVSSGKISVKTHGQSITGDQTFNIVNVLQGTYTDNLTLTADKKYLLRGNVIFNGKLIIEPGTVIYGEKLTHGSLAVSNIDFQGTADKPIVFTSDQAPGSRQPGDWTGLTTIAAYETIPLGIAEYVRIEYAGAHRPGSRGAAWNLTMDASSVFRYIQVSYSAGNGITMTSQYNSFRNSYIEHIVAFGCGGDDFRDSTTAGLIAQYGLSLKDPYYADPLQGNGLAIVYGGPSSIFSNFTIIGYNPAARNINSPAGLPLTANAGRGVKIGDGSDNNDQVYLYNSVIAGCWSAGISLYGNSSYSFPPASNWGNYEDSIPPDPFSYDISLRNNYITSTGPVLLPYKGGMLARESYSSGVNALSGFEDISGTPQLALFGIYNDTTRLLDLIQGKDDLGLRGLTDYQQMNHPSMLPTAGSPLLTGAWFDPLTPANTPELNKDVPYIGAFGTQDWTQGWTNFNPQQTSY